MKKRKKFELPCFLKKNNFNKEIPLNAIKFCENSYQRLNYLYFDKKENKNEKTWRLEERGFLV